MRMRRRIRTLTDVLETRGYQVVESNGSELVSRAVFPNPTSSF